MTFSPFRLRFLLALLLGVMLPTAVFAQADEPTEPAEPSDTPEAVEPLEEVETPILLPAKETFLKNDDIQLSAAMSFSGGYSVRPSVFRQFGAFSDLDVGIGLRMNFGFTVIKADPNIPNSGELTVRLGFGGPAGASVFSNSNIAFGTLRSNTVSNLQLSIGYAYALYENFLNIKDFDIWVGERAIGGARVPIVLAQPTGYAYGIRGFGIQARPNDAFTVRFDTGFRHEFSSFYRDANFAFIRTTAQQMNAQGNPLPTEYFQFIEGTGQERFRQIWVGAGFFELPLNGENGYEGANAFVRLNASLLTIGQMGGGYYNPAPGDDIQPYGKQRTWLTTDTAERIPEDVGWPRETGYSIGGEVIVEDLGFVRRNTLQVGFQQSLGVTNGFIGQGLATALDGLIELRPQAFELRQEERTINNLRRFSAANAVEFEWDFGDDRILNLGFGAGGVFINEGLTGRDGSTSLFATLVATYVLNEYLQLLGSVNYRIEFLPDSFLVLQVRSAQNTSASATLRLSFDGSTPRPTNFLSIGAGMIYASPGYVRVYLRDPVTGRDIRNANLSPILGVSANFSF